MRSGAHQNYNEAFMSRTLPRLRPALDIIPSPDAARPGLVLRDPYRYAETILHLPPVWAASLEYLDGSHTELDLQEFLTRATGRLVFSNEVREFVGTLQKHGFLDTEEFHSLRERREAEFRQAPERAAAHAGAAYPASAPEVRAAFDSYFRAGDATPDGPAPGLVGIAAPHVSLEGGSSCYAAAYRPLAGRPELAQRTFVILGTSHYGGPEKFGVTRKPFVTPLGALPVATELLDGLEQRAPDAICQEDYCHSIEHSIEFQCVFLQHVLGSGFRILPILCGPFTESLHTGRAPETSEELGRFFTALGGLAEQYAGRLFWVLGVDMAHIGRRYGDSFQAVAGRGPMAAVDQEDRRRLDRICAGDPEGFFDLVKRDGDELRWCGYSPLYTFLKVVPGARGRLLRYEQWNIDSQSVVSFAGLQFFHPAT